MTSRRRGSTPTARPSRSTAGGRARRHRSPASSRSSKRTPAPGRPSALPCGRLRASTKTPALGASTAPTTYAGCSRTTTYVDVKKIAMTCAAWKAAGNSLPTLDSGTIPVCAQTAITGFTPTWHAPRQAERVQLDADRRRTGSASTPRGRPASRRPAPTGRGDRGVPERNLPRLLAVERRRFHVERARRLPGRAAPQRRRVRRPRRGEDRRQRLRRRARSRRGVRPRSVLAELRGRARPRESPQKSRARRRRTSRPPASARPMQLRRPAAARSSSGDAGTATEDRMLRASRAGTTDAQFTRRRSRWRFADLDRNEVPASTVGSSSSRAGASRRSSARARR